VAKSCGLCGYAAKDSPDFDEHMRRQHQWDQVVRSSAEKAWLHPALGAVLAVLWLFALPILFPLAVRNRDHGLDLRRLDHVIAVLMVPGVAIFMSLDSVIGPFFLRRTDDYQIDSFSRAIEFVGVNLCFLAIFGVARLLRTARPL
jgi:hypothetical protein